jgi:Ca2+-binding EF-hand superfamily protein
MSYIQGNPYTEEGRVANFALLDSQGKGDLDINDMKYINEQLKYGYTEEELEDLIRSVGGFGAENISKDRYCKIIEKRVKARKAGI